MGAIFGKRKPPSRVTDQDKAVLQLKQQRDKLKVYQRRIEQTLAADRLVAKKLLNDGKIERAKLLLRKKQYQEKLLTNTDNQLENLEKMVHDIEFAQIEIQLLDGLKQGNKALKKMHESLNIAEIERIMDETREGVEKQQEIDAILTGELTAEDEAAAEAELDEILKSSVLLLPDVPGEQTPLEDPPSSSPTAAIAKEKRGKTSSSAKVALTA